MRSAAIIIFLILFAAAIHAQSSGSRREDPLLTKLQKQMQLEMLEAALSAHPASPREREAAISQVKEDFLGIQLANDNLIIAVWNNTSIDTRAVARAASEIRTRARRLKENLALPRPQKRDPSEANLTPDIRFSSKTLSQLINSFVTNPMLSQKHVIDTDLALQASRDLEDIIVLSGWIRKNAGN